MTSVFVLRYFVNDVMIALIISLKYKISIVLWWSIKQLDSLAVIEVEFVKRVELNILWKTTALQND